MRMDIVFYIGIGAVALLLIFALLKRAQIVAWLNQPEVVEKIKDFCRWAEAYYIGTELGRQRLKAVCRKLYALAPAKLREFIPWSMLEKYVHIIFESIAVTTEDGHRKAV